MKRPKIGEKRPRANVAEAFNFFGRQAESRFAKFCLRAFDARKRDFTKLLDTIDDRVAIGKSAKNKRSLQNKQPQNCERARDRILPTHAILHLNRKTEARRVECNLATRLHTLDVFCHKCERNKPISLKWSNFVIATRRSFLVFLTFEAKQTKFVEI